MPRSHFDERTFTCSVCGEPFTALTGNQPVRDPVCMHCGLRHSPEQRRRLTEERRKKSR